MKVMLKALLPTGVSRIDSCGAQVYEYIAVGQPFNSDTTLTSLNPERFPGQGNPRPRSRPPEGEDIVSGRERRLQEVGSNESRSTGDKDFHASIRRPQRG